MPTCSFGKVFEVDETKMQEILSEPSFKLDNTFKSRLVSGEEARVFLDNVLDKVNKDKTLPC